MFLVALVTALHLPYFGNPAIHIDEQFYLAVADKWVNHGLIPYVDIWDRKPIGIFAIYALAVLLFKNAILGYQIIATVCVVATSCLVATIGDMVSGRRVGLFAGIIYAVAVMLMEGAGGQTPVFYNLLVAGGVAGIFQIIRFCSVLERRTVVMIALLAGLLFGTALQVNYICVVEVSALSVFLLLNLHVEKHWRSSRLLGLALGMMLCGLLPTILVASWYASKGHWGVFFSANFESIFHKHLWRLGAREYVRRFIRSSLFVIVFLPFAARGFFLGISRVESQARQDLLRAICVWTLAALAGAMSLGNPTRHYFLPTLVPVSILVSFGFFDLTMRQTVLGRWTARANASIHGLGGMGAILAVPIAASFIIAKGNALQRGEPSDIYSIGAYMKAYDAGGCAFVFNRLPILYYLSDRCAPSIYMFPNHLSEASEVETATRGRLRELRRVLASKPAMIFVRRPHTADIDPEAIDMLEETLHANYRLVREWHGSGQLYCIYVPLHNG